VIDAVSALPLAQPLAARLNQHCACRFLDHDRLRQQLALTPELSLLADQLGATHPHLFSETMIYVPAAQIAAMTALVAAVTRALNTPGWRAAVGALAPPIARTDPGPLGVFQGFDFHLDAHGPQLIEVNTNAGGALLNLALGRAQNACCPEVAPLFGDVPDFDALEGAFIDMFVSEWQRQGRSGRPATLAIVDDEPAQQYLYPEFRLFQNLFERAGIATVIADPRALDWREGTLFCEGRAIDLVYNRLTDFYFEHPASQALRAAYEARAVVVTPHPYAHALYADKRHLVTLSDDARLQALGLDASTRALLCAGVPETRQVQPDQAEALWAQRKEFFFKPADGFGGRAAYRGDKMTRKSWQYVLENPYVAQRIAVPGERLVAVDGTGQRLKLDIRAFAYDGEIQLFAARLYAGQTTNFRTPGGGFAPVFITPD